MASLRHIINRANLLIVILLVGLAAGAPVMAQGDQPASIAGQVVFAVGDAYVVSRSGPEPATVGTVVMAGDRLVTGVHGYIHLRMADGAFLGIRADSLLEINEYMFDVTRPENSRVRLFLQEGTVRAISGHIAHENKENFRLNTPLAAIGVRGTDFVTAADQWNTQVAVASGGIAMAPYSGQCVVAELGPCKGDNVTDLYANQQNAFLVVRQGQTSAQIISSDLESQFAPPHPQEKYDSSPNTGDAGSRVVNNELLSVLTFVLQQSLTEQEIKDLDLLPEDAALDLKELVQIDTLELTNIQNAVGVQPAYRQKLDRKVVNIQDQAFDIVNQSDPLLRYFDQTGMLAWSATADAAKFDERIVFMQKGQSYQALMDKIGVGSYLQGFGMEALQVDTATAAWESYYQHGIAAPVAQLGSSNLYHAQGLQALQIPAFNRYFPAVNLAYDTVDSTVLNATHNLVIDKVTFKINHSNGVFEAKIAITDLINGSQEYLVTGSFNASGMVFGGNEKASVEGLVINDSGQIATLLHYSNNQVVSDALLVFDDASLAWPEAALEAAPTLYKADDDATINWGRWEHYAPLDDQVIDRLNMASLELVASNSHFALFQPATATASMPMGNAFRFYLDSYEALHVADNGTTTATLTDATLNVDFSTAQFTTQMNVMAPRLSAPVSVFAKGSVDALGELIEQRQMSNINLAGMVTDQAQGVGMLFEHQLQDGSAIVAATQWALD